VDGDFRAWLTAPADKLMVGKKVSKPGMEREKGWGLLLLYLPHIRPGKRTRVATERGRKSSGDKGKKERRERASFLVPPFWVRFAVGGESEFQPGISSDKRGPVKKKRRERKGARRRHGGGRWQRKNLNGM